MMKKWTWPLLSILLIALAGCGNMETSTGGGQDNRTADTQPVTLSLFVDGAINDQEIDKFIVGPVQKKYPNISFTIAKKGGGITSDTFVASGAELDLVYTSYNLIEAWRQLDVPDNLSGMIKKYKTDLSKFDPAVVDEIKAYSGKDEILALPVMQNIAATIYNKDIFDKFGVPYPKDLMSWDETIALARKVTRSEGGIRYIGLSPPSLSHVGQGLSLPYVNPDTQKAAINNDSWKKVYSLMEELFKIPDFRGTNTKYKNLNSDFFGSGSIAMYFAYVPDVIAQVDGEKAKKINWDLATLPNFREAVGTGWVAASFIMMVSKSGTHKDAAFQAASVVASDEVQAELSKDGKLSVLTSADIQRKYAANVPMFQGKNIAGIFKAAPRKINVPNTEFDVTVRSAVDSSAKELAAGKDTNTLLRETEEKANQAIEATRKK